MENSLPNSIKMVHPGSEQFSLSIMLVNLSDLSVKQWPSLGVHTKFHKHATTYLFDIPDLLAIVMEWEREVRTILSPNGLWFAPISPETGEFNPTVTEPGKHRHTRTRHDLKEWLIKVGLPYYSPHKFRHGHAVFGLKNAKDIPALKAVRT
jgi:integrase